VRPRVMHDLAHPGHDPVGTASGGWPWIRARRERSKSARLLTFHHHDWDRFVASSVNGAIFHTVWWQREWGLEPTVRVITNNEREVKQASAVASDEGLGQRRSSNFHLPWPA